MNLENIHSGTSYVKREDYSILSFTHRNDVVYLRDDITLTKQGRFEVDERVHLTFTFRHGVWSDLLATLLDAD